MKERRGSSALAMGLRLSCINSLIYASENKIIVGSGESNMLGAKPMLRLSVSYLVRLVSFDWADYTALKAIMGFINFKHGAKQKIRNYNPGPNAIRYTQMKILMIRTAFVIWYLFCQSIFSATPGTIQVFDYTWQDPKWFYCICI